MKWFVYIARCKDDSLYTGVSSNPKRREWQHNNSKRGAKSLRGKTPVKIIYSEAYLSKSKALRREREIKGWRREKKQKLINSLN
jgi:putative endonuclease